MKRASKRMGGGYIRLGFLKFIFCCIYSLSFKFFRLRVVSRALRSFLLASLLLIFCFISFSRYLWKPSVFASSGPLHLPFVMSVSSSYLCVEISEEMLTSARLHQISHVAEHLLNLLTLRASCRKLGRILLPAN